MKTCSGDVRIKVNVTFLRHEVCNGFPGTRCKGEYQRVASAFGGAFRYSTCYCTVASWHFSARLDEHRFHTHRRTSTLSISRRAFIFSTPQRGTKTSLHYGENNDSIMVGALLSSNSTRKDNLKVYGEIPLISFVQGGLWYTNLVSRRSKQL